MRMFLWPTVSSVALCFLSCGEAPGTLFATSPMGRVTVLGPPPPPPIETVWPNPQSQANSDAWLVTHHRDLKVLKPKVLVLDISPTDEDGNAGMPIENFLPKLVSAFEAMSRDHEYLGNSSPGMLQYQIDKVLNLRDENGALFPSYWPKESKQGFDVGQLFTAEFNVRWGYEKPGGGFYSLCELFEEGLINELWISSPLSGKRNVYENQSRLMKYDDAFRPLGTFNTCTNGCLVDPGKHLNCKVSVRLQEINRWRGVGCGTHSAGHTLENLKLSIPYLADNMAAFLNFQLDTRHTLPFESQYVCPYGQEDKTCFEYPAAGMMTAGSNNSIPRFSFSKWTEGCGNVHFPPNARNHYEYDRLEPVEAHCAHFGEPAAQATEYSATWVENYEKLHGDCGGGWLTYWGQSFPSAQRGALDTDGQPALSWWPFLFY